MESTETGSYGYCPFCGASLKRNVHEAETRSGRIIFPALIFAAICVVLFVYLLNEWFLFLALGVVVFALVYEQISISKQIPSDWPKWHLVETKVVVELDKENVHLMLGGLWLAVFVITLLIQLPKWSWLNSLGIFVGVCWITLGIRGKYSAAKSRDLANK
jgi:hypothetical protein